MISVLVVYVWFMAGNQGGAICSQDPLISPSVLCLENVYDWLGLYSVDQLRNGRKGLLLVFIGAYCCHLHSLLVVPVWSDFDIKPDAIRAAELQQIAINKKRKILRKPVVVRMDEDVEEKIMPSSVWIPHIWRRANIMLLFLFVVFVMVLHIELSYSSPFQEQVYEFIVIFQILYFSAEELIFKIACVNVVVRIIYV